MALDTAAFANAMKTLYIGPLNDLIFRASAFLDRIVKNSEDVAGNFAYLPLITARNPAVGSRRDSSSGPALPQAGRQSYGAASFTMAYHYGRGEISGPVMRASKSDKAAFARALDVEMKGLMERLPEDLNRQVTSLGHGRAATLAANGSAGVTFQMSATSQFNLRIGDRVHFADIAGAYGALSGADPAVGTTVANIIRDQAAGQHQIILTDATSAAVTASADALYFGIGVGGGNLVAGDSSRGQEMWGIQSALDDGAIGADEATVANAAETIQNNLNFGQIDRSVAAGTYFRTKVMPNPDGAGTLRQVTVSLLEQGFLHATTIAGAKPTDIEMWTTPSLWATIGLLQIGSRIFNDFKETVENGFIAIKWNGRPIFADKDFPRNIIWFISVPTMHFLSQSGYEMMDEDGSVLHRVANRDAYEFSLYRDCQLGCTDPARSVKMTDCASLITVEG